MLPTLLIASVLAFVPAQADTPDADAPISAPDEAAPDEAAPADDAGDEGADAAEAPAASEADEGDDAGVEVLPPADSSNGLDPWVSMPIQMAAGCGTAAVCGVAGTTVSYICGVPCLVIPYLGPLILGSLNMLIQLGITPVVVGSVEAILGDLVSANRGTFLWTVLASYGGALCGGAAYFGTTFAAVAAYAIVVGGGAAALGALLDPDAIANAPTALLANGGLAGAYLAGLAGMAAGGLLGAGLYAGIPAATFALTSEPKAAHDDGFRFPGFTSPNHAPPPGEGDDEEYEGDEDEGGASADDGGDEGVGDAPPPPPEEINPEESLPTFDEDPGMAMGY